MNRRCDIWAKNVNFFGAMVVVRSFVAFVGVFLSCLSKFVLDMSFVFCGVKKLYNIPALREFCTVFGTTVSHCI